MTPLRRPKSAAPVDPSATGDDNDKSEEQKLEDSLRETLGGINGEGVAQEKSRRPKSAAIKKKGRITFTYETTKSERKQERWF